MSDHADDRADYEPVAVVRRILRATNEHDIDALVACFADDYVSQWPQHPARSFTGTEQVHRNWSQLFGAVPDLTADLVDCTVHRETAWTEWEFGGHRVDGGVFLLRGVTVFVTREGRAVHGRFYLEPVELDSGDADDAVRRLVGSAQRSAS
jgi:ketosteroid isomerase-like protein